MARKPIDDHQHFRVFAANLESAIAGYGVDDRSMVARQREQVETLVGLEKEFRRTLIRHPWGPSVYRDFITYICDDRRNILAARPYFRERQAVFTARISRALKNRAEKSLFKYHFNYQFILFAMGAKNWAGNRIGAKVVDLASRIRAVRTELVEMNLPLAISRARIFWSRTPTAQLTYMDLVQITAEGLMSGVDKFCLPYTAAFRHVLIGRMLGNMIENYSETMVHFYPCDKRKIYRANKSMSRNGDNFEKISEDVNSGAEPSHKTTPAEIAALMAAASTVSTDLSPGQDADEQDRWVASPQYQLKADETQQPDIQVEAHEALRTLALAIPDLGVVDRKLLRLKGVAL